MYKKSLVYLFILASLIISGFCFSKDADLEKRKNYLLQLQQMVRPEQPDRGQVTFQDKTWQDWLDRTGELPPDLDAMPSIPFLPDPLIIDEGGKNIQVKNTAQWNEKRKWIKQQIQHWVTGTFPPAPDNIKAEILNETKTGQITERNVLLTFGPDNKAKLHVNLLIPEGNAPFPVFLTQMKKNPGWSAIALRRGYIACRFTATDPRYGFSDDSEEYAEIYPDYDFSCISRWAWAAQRAMDYLYTLPQVDKTKIALTGHSRNGKAALIAAAFDERIAAVIPSSAGTVGENPFRFTSDNFDNESIEEITTIFPYWFSPRLRFFIGNEHKLPIDQNLMMALIAPRGLMFSSAITEHQGDPLGIELCYRSVQQVYELLGAKDKLAIRFRNGRHDIAARDVEDYMDFFDYVFGRTKIKPPQKTYYNYSFEKWKNISNEKPDVKKFPVKTEDDIVTAQSGKDITVKQWQEKRNEIINNIQWLLGSAPPGLSYIPQLKVESLPTEDTAYTGDHIARTIGRADLSPDIGRRVISGGNGFTDYIEGYLYYPQNKLGQPVSNNLPVVVYLHEYAYPTGFARRYSDIVKGFAKNGFAVFVFDQVGFGTRILEAENFYYRYPHWSKMGRMVADTQNAYNALSGVDIINKDKIYVGGYSLGGTVALYTAAIDQRFAGAFSVCGFTPMRTDTQDKPTGGIENYSNIHGLIPRLGFFLQNENRIPVDFDEIIAAIAPRPVLIVSPTTDRFADLDDVKKCIQKSNKIYALYNNSKNLELLTPLGFNKFTTEIQENVFDWTNKNFK